MPANTDARVRQVKMIGTLSGIEWMNVFYYASPSASGTVLSFLNAFVAIVSPLWQGLISGQAVWLRAEGQDVKGATNFDSTSVGVAGGVSGDVLPPFNSFDFTLLRDGVGERNGYKRFAGVSESAQQNGVITSGALAAANALAAGMFSHVIDVDDEWVPVVRRTRVHKVVQIPPVYFDVSNVQYSKIGSQNTRKFGHGR